MTDKLQACLEKIPNVTSLKPEQTQAVEALLAGKDVLAILPTGFGKSLIYQVFSMAQTSANASVLVISPLKSIVEEQAKEMNCLGIPSVHLKPDIEDCLHDISDGHFRMILASAEDCLSRNFTEILKGAEPHSKLNISLVVIDNSSLNKKCCQNDKPRVEREPLDILIVFSKALHFLSCNSAYARGGIFFINVDLPKITHNVWHVMFTNL